VIPVVALLALMAEVLSAQTADTDGTPGLKYTLLAGGKEYSVDKGKVKAGAVVIPDSYNNLPVTTIAPKAFSSSAITGITIPNSVTSIGDQAFKSCKNLTGITIPNSVITMGKETFDSCKNLASVTIGNGVTSIGKQAFYKCTSLTSVTIGNSVTDIGESAFSQCDSLTSITIPDSVTSIGKQAFFYCGLTSVTIGNGVSSIGQMAFYKCTKLTSVTIPNSVISIGEEAFYNCTGLTNITLGNGVTRIGESAFFQCTGLTSITIPGSVSSIGRSAFIWCNNLTSIMFQGRIESHNLGSFVDNDFKPAFPGDLHNYRVVSGKYTRIEGDTSWNRGESFGSVEALKAFLDSQPANNPNTSIKVFIRVTDKTIMNLANLIKTAGKYVDLSFNFANFSSSAFYIPPNAFRDCVYLTGLTLDGGLDLSTMRFPTIGNGAFINCPNLTSVSLKNVDHGGDVFDGTFVDDAFSKDSKLFGDMIVDGRTYTRETGGATWRNRK
jgi:hypothetical protein